MSEEKTDLGLERTKLALIRNDFAMMRTGFTIASFGAGVAQLLGRGAWPDWLTDTLTALFMVSGIILIQVGIRGASSGARDIRFDLKTDSLSKALLFIAPWILQMTLVLMLVASLVY